MAVELASLNLYRMVRQFALQTPDYADAIRYFTKPDERLMLPLASWRIYKNWDEALTIQAAAGLDSPEDEMTERLLVLPPATLLAQMKQTAGFPVVLLNR
jgi:hypothetical protein